jgi:hypothetical protein
MALLVMSSPVCFILCLLKSAAKVRISERKAKEKPVFLFAFPSESTFGEAKGENKRAKSKGKMIIRM